MMNSSVRPCYWLELEGRRFAIRPIKVAGFYLEIDCQSCGYFFDAKKAAEDCKFGHISTVITGAKPYLVATRHYDFPADLNGWNEGSEEPLELNT